MLLTAETYTTNIDDGEVVPAQVNTVTDRGSCVISQANFGQYQVAEVIFVHQADYVVIGNKMKVTP